MSVQREDVLGVLSSRWAAGTTSASVARCLEDLARLADTRADLPSLSKLQAAVKERSQGELVVQCLRAYEERLRDPERALAAVYEWARGHAPKLYPPVLHSEADLTTAFASGKAQKARGKASDLYGDCFMVLSEFVTAWNRQQIKAVN